MAAPYANFTKPGAWGFATGVAPPENDDWVKMQAQFGQANHQQDTQNTFQGQQAQADRNQQQAQWDWTGQQNNLNRGLQQQQASAQHDWNTQAQNSAQGFQGTQADLQRTFQGQQAASQNAWQGGQNQSARDLQTALQSSQQGFQGTQADLQRQFETAAQTAQNTFQGSQNTAERTNQMGIAQLPWNFKKGVFDQVSPLLMRLIGNGAAPAGGAAGNGFGLVGGQNTPQPPITAGPIWGQDQINQQVNNQRANNAAAASGQQQQLQRQLAGQGFGSNSPLLAALGSGIQNQRMGADQKSDLDTRWGAAEGNAKQMLAGQTAQEGQWADWNQADIQRRQAANQATGIQNNYTSSLIAALAGMV